MTRLSIIAFLLTALASAGADDPTSTDKTLSKREFGEIRRQVETLRGKTFLRPVPVYNISEKELRAISDRELDKEFPGAKLHSYEELLAWLDIVPPHTDLKSAYGDFLAGQVAGLYDSETKEMCIPSPSTGSTNLVRKAAEKKLEALAPAIDNLVLAHEFTHALEDQYWPIDDPKDHNPEASTDRDVAHVFLAEGSATRQMIEVIPAQWGQESPRTYFGLWNAIHSPVGEFLLRYELSHAWKSSDALVGGVPDALARTEAMPYSFGYNFCSEVMRHWGLGGLDYVYNHPPVSSTQVMHPKKYWQWRDLPVRIVVSTNLPGGWTQISSDCLGEAGIATLFGCSFKNLNYGLQIARGWDGDHVALFEGPRGHRLLLWASSWDSTNAAGRYLSAWMRERQVVHQAAVTRTNTNLIEWESSDGRAGFIKRDGRRVILLETDTRETLQDSDVCSRSIVFTEPPEDATRAAANSPLRRFNPLWSRQTDADYTVSRSLGGLVSSHERNSVGTANKLLLGILAETRHTASFHKWELGSGLVAHHESDTRRGTTKTTWLPWGLLASHCATRLPQSPEKTITHTTVVWGLGASLTIDGAGTHSTHLLPFGVLLRRTTGPDQSTFHILGTGRAQQQSTKYFGSIVRYRFLGIPIWSSHNVPSQTGQSYVRPDR